MNRSDQINEIALALSKTQGKIKFAEKNSYNKFLDSHYAGLDSSWEACRDALCENELAVIQTTEFDDKDIWIETILTHKSGQWFSGRYPLTPTKKDPQGLAAAMTYGRRVALQAMVMVCPYDDDGHEASKPQQTQKIENKISPQPKPQEKKTIPNVAPSLTKRPTLDQVNAIIKAAENSGYERHLLDEVMTRLTGLEKWGQLSLVQLNRVSEYCVGTSPEIALAEIEEERFMKETEPDPKFFAGVDN